MTSPLRGPAPHPQGRGHGAGGIRGDHEFHGGRAPEASVAPTPRGLPQASPQGEEALLAALAAAGVSRSAVRYRGFVLLPQPDLGWLVRPERSPMTVLPFRTPPISLCDVKALVDWRLDQATLKGRPRR
jgi:hypothetical protein